MALSASDVTQTPGAPVVVVGVEIRHYGIEDKIAALARQLNLAAGATFMGGVRQRLTSATHDRT